MGQRLYKRAGSDNYYVFLGRGPDGKKIYKSTGCRDRRAAERVAGELERELHAPPDQAKNSPTLSVALGRAVDDRRNRGRAEGTLGMYDVKGQHLARLLGADTTLDRIDAAAVDDYTTQRTNEGASRYTLDKEFSVLRVTLKHARRRGEYPHDPAAVLPQGWDAGYDPKERALTPAEMRRILADLMDDELPMVRRPPGPARKKGSKRSLAGPAPTETAYARTRTRSMKERAARVAWIVATSGRWSESERARPEDINWKTGLVLVRGSKTDGAWRYVPILPTTAPLLRLALEHGNDEGTLFVPWTNARRDLHAMCKRLDIEPVSANDLRRTTAQWLIDADVEPHLVSAVLGHKDTRMVERVYGKMKPETLKRALLGRLAKVKALTPKAKRTAPGLQKRRNGRRNAG